MYIIITRRVHSPYYDVPHDWSNIVYYSNLGGLSKVFVENRHHYDVEGGGREGGGVLVHDVIRLHCQQILVAIIHSCG